MCMKSPRVRISRREFNMANPKHFRKMRSGVWTYWRLL